MIEKSENYSGCITYHSITVLMCYLEIAKTIFFFISLFFFFRFGLITSSRDIASIATIIPVNT